LGIYNSRLKTHNFNRDYSKTLFNHFLLHEISLSRLGVKTKNTKTTLKHNTPKHNRHNTINDYPMEPSKKPCGSLKIININTKTLRTYHGNFLESD